MPEPLNGPALGRWLAEKVARGEITARVGLHRLGMAIEARAKEDLNANTHSRGTTTPASPGGPPAKISGDLMRSITTTDPTGVAGRIEVRVGPASTPHSGSTATSGRIGRALEADGKGSNRYPFMRPAAQAVAPTGGRIFAETWIASRKEI